MKKIRGILFSALLLPAMLLSGFTADAAPGYEEIGKSTKEPVGSAAMTPITGAELSDGTYEIEVRSSSKFFKIEKAFLTVKDGEMTALLDMYSASYSMVYPGTAEEAAKAPFGDYILTEEIDGWDTFTIPVKALNTPIDLASFSKKKEKWYPREILFDASTLPEGTLPFELPDFDLVNEALAEYEENHPEQFADTEKEPEQTEDDLAGEAVYLDMEDGSYSIECVLAGGSGRASVTSPTWFYVKEGQAYAKLLWSSTYYDYMIVAGTRCDNETTDGSNSTFTIPVLAMDEPFEVIADTTAMGDPLEIEYTLTFYEDSIGSKQNVPQEGAKKVVLIAVCVMVIGGIINYFVKKKRK